mgnify:FL=1
MIATILPSSTCFHAVGYNERKVVKGVAHLLEMKNFGVVEMLEHPGAADLVSYLDSYSSRNPRIRKAQFHVAFSCKGHEMTEQELLDFAHEYLRQMGYGKEGQPLLVYGHTDTDNTHIHVITSRVAPDGSKIDHNHERVRSQRIIDRILGNETEKKARQDMEEAMSYKFSSITQFKALMNSLGYECYENEGEVSIKRGGAVCLKVPLSDISERFTTDTYDRQRRRQLRAIFAKYRDLTANRKELASVIKSKFGIDLVFFGKSDSPYGYMIIDHNKKSVINGGRIYPIKELLDFSTADERLERIDSFIDTQLSDNPKISIPEVNAILKRQHRAYIKGGHIYRGDDKRPMQPHMWDALRRNNRIKWVESFAPSTEAERDFLCGMAKVTVPGMVELASDKTDIHRRRCDDLREIFNDGEGYIRRQTFKEAGFTIQEIDGKKYAFDMKSRVLIDLAAEGFDMSRMKYTKYPPVAKSGKSARPVSPRGSARKITDAETGRGQNREWEVGYKGDYDRIDDGSNIRR